MNMETLELVDKPMFNEQGKIVKGKHYSKPDLKPFLG